MAYPAMPQPQWMLRLKVGDVISNGGRYRVVRQVSRRKSGNLGSVHLAIRRCSWTHRCYTVLTANDLRQTGYRRVNVKARRLRSALDRKIQDAMRQGGCYTEELILTCCDVESAA